MPHDRRTRRTCLILIGVVCSAVPIGCLRSSNLRPASGPLPELTPAGEPPRRQRVRAPFRLPDGAREVLSPTAAPMLPTLRAASKPDGTHRVEALPDGSRGSSDRIAAFRCAAAGRGEAAIEPCAPRRLRSGAGRRTVQTRAAARVDSPPRRRDPRVEAVTRQHSESLNSGETAESSPGASMALPTRPILDRDGSKPSEAVSEPADATSGSTRPPPQGTAEPSPLPISLRLRRKDRQPPGCGSPHRSPKMAQAPAPARPEATERTGERPAPRPPAPEPKQDEAVERAADPVPPDPVESADLDTFGTTPAPANRRAEVLRQCAWLRGVRASGRNGDQGRPIGQGLLRDRRSGLPGSRRSFVSRLSSHIGAPIGRGGPILWEQALPIAEDVWHRPRRDYYVWYCIKLPLPLEPGSYRLRLVETDLIAERTTSAELPLTIAP